MHLYAQSLTARGQEVEQLTLYLPRQVDSEVPGSESNIKMLCIFIMKVHHEIGQFFCAAIIRTFMLNHKTARSLVKRMTKSFSRWLFSGAELQSFARRAT